MKSIHLLTLATALTTAFAFAEEAESLKIPAGILLTWQQDPTTTMTIDWHRLAEEAEAPSVIQARPRGTEGWKDFPAQRLTYPFTDRIFDRVELTGLQPATEYEFRGSPDAKSYWFRTMPKDLEKPLVIAVGGDIDFRKDWMKRMNIAAMKLNPDFVVWGGDFAYGNGEEKLAHRWHEFFEAKLETLITEDGRIPPIVGCIGNHEVRGGYHRNRIKTDEDRLEYAPNFYRFFAFPGLPGYNVLDFGDYLSLVIGDSEHSNPVAGAQTEWMRKTLEARRNVPYVIPIYHVPAWPSVRPFDNEQSKAVREHWVPLFEQNGIRVAFEHHDHIYKRTVPIFNGEENREKGIVYLGDGAWGVNTRRHLPPSQVWYIEDMKQYHHAWFITMHKDRMDIEAIGRNSKPFDSITIPAR